MDRHTSETISWIGFFITVMVCAFFISTCAVAVSDADLYEKRNKLEAENGESISNQRPAHWSHGDTREVEDTVLQSE